VRTGNSSKIRTSRRPFQELKAIPVSIRSPPIRPSTQDSMANPLSNYPRILTPDLQPPRRIFEQICSASTLIVAIYQLVGDRLGLASMVPGRALVHLVKTRCFALRTGFRINFFKNRASRLFISDMRGAIFIPRCGTELISQVAPWS
jgi:hypothetical protein